MQERQKTLVILSPGFPKDEDDTTCLPTQQLFVRALQSEYPELKIVVLAFQYPFVNATYKWNGIDVISFHTQQKGIINHAVLWLRIWGLLKQLKRKNSIIGLLSFWCTEYAMVGKYFAQYYHLRHYIWLKGQDARAGNPFVKFIRPKPEEMIAISDFIAEEFCRNYKVKPAHVVPNAIDESLFSNKPEIRDIDILGVGSLIPLKQYNLFIEIVVALKKRHSAIKVMICGKGVEEENLRKQVAQLHLQEHVTLTGERSHNEVIRLMERSKILLHTSSYEGFSTVCLEAIGAGVHVVSFCKPMNEDIENWHIVKSKEEMADVALQILNGPGTQYKPIIKYTISETTKSIMKLMCY